MASPKDNKTDGVPRTLKELHARLPAEITISVKAIKRYSAANGVEYHATGATTIGDWQGRYAFTGVVLGALSLPDPDNARPQPIRRRKGLQASS